LSLRASGMVWLEAAGGAGMDRVRALARAAVVQYVLWHAPAHALLAVVAPPALAHEWEWVKWLPHARHPRRHDLVGPLRTITTVAEATALARRLARLRAADVTTAGDAAPAAPAGLPALLGLAPGPAGIAALRARWARSEADRLRVPIGVDENGGAVTLDLKEAA